MLYNKEDRTIKLSKGDHLKTEDAIMKKSMEIFQKSALTFFNIHDEIKGIANVELKDIMIKTHVLDGGDD